MLKDILTEDILKEGKFWTDSITAIEGCAHASEGCLNCWAEANHRLRSANPKSGFSPDVLTDGKWNGKIIEHPERLERIIPKSNRRRPKVFTYWEDTLHEKVSDLFLFTFFRTIAFSKDYHIICTKRPESLVKFYRRQHENIRRPCDMKNVIILVTMETQDMVDERGPDAIRLANMGWQVCALVEPMLTPVDLEIEAGQGVGSLLIENLKWVVCGPENGKGRRHFNPWWALELKDQCRESGVPFYFKANGGMIGHEGPFLEVPEV